MVLLFIWIAWKREQPATHLVIGICCIVVFLLQEAREPAPHPMEGTYSGTLEFLASPKLDGDRLRGFAMTEDGLKVYANYKIPRAEEKDWLDANLSATRFIVNGAFEWPTPPAHRYAFDMSDYLKKNGASAMLSVSRINSVERIDSFMIKLAAQRERISAHIRHTFPESLAAEAEALLIGERELMTLEQQRTYQTLGITHLFAISGLHVGITAGLVYFLLIRLRVRKEPALVVMIILLPLYAILVGGAPSVWRAVGMAVAVFSCRLIKVRIPVSQIFLICFIVAILWNPYTIHNIGFQLSYGATFGIIYSMKFLAASDSNLKTGFYITFISQMTLYPLLLLHFYEISLSAFLVNSLFVPLYTIVILPVNFILLALSAGAPAVSGWAFALYEPLRALLEKFMEWLASWPYQLWNPGKPELWLATLMFASVFLFYCLAEKRLRPRYMVIILIPVLFASLLPYADNALKVTFLDVGQGDSAIIELPNRKAVYVIDTGGVLRFEGEIFQERRQVYEVGRQVVVPYLKGNGISGIETLILSHPDADHAEGAEEVLELIRTKEIHATPGTLENEAMKDIIPHTSRAELHFPGAGSSWSKGDVDFLYLSPTDWEYEGNDDSLVLLMQQDDFSIVFTGDLEQEGERGILTEYAHLLDDVAVLKVGHHGSKTSSGQSFLEALSPAISVFSTGIDNRYNHPSPEVVERFQALSLPTLNTADNGTIEIKYKDGQMYVETSR